MWPFKRKNKQNQTEVPQEVQEYYQSERRERTGIAWLLALATLAVTVVLAIILFFGGRWLYRTFFGDNGQNGTGTTQQDQVEDEGDGTDGTTLPGDGNGTDNGTPDSVNGDSDEPGDSDTENQEAPERTTPATGSTDLPRTGPEGELF